MGKCTEGLPWIYWVVLWYFWDNQANMNSHHYMARDGAALITALLGAKKIHFRVWGWKLRQRSRGRAAHFSVPAMEMYLWHNGHCSSQGWSLAYARVQDWCLTLFLQAWSLARQGSGGQSSAAQRGAFVWCFLCCWCHRGAGAEQPCTGTKQLCCHSCNHTRECFARVVYSSCIC